MGSICLLLVECDKKPSNLHIDALMKRCRIQTQQILPYIKSRMQQITEINELHYNKTQIQISHLSPHIFILIILKKKRQENLQYLDHLESLDWVAAI